MPFTPNAFLMCLVLGTGSGALSGELPERLRRADSFLGIHFDFHAGPDCTEVGKNTTREMMERIIDLVHPELQPEGAPKGRTGTGAEDSGAAPARGGGSPGVGRRASTRLRCWASITSRVVCTAIHW